MRYLTPKEKVALMNSVNAQNMDDLNGIVPVEALSEDPISHRVIAKVNLRQRIIDKMKECGLSQRQLALRIGIFPQHLNGFLTGRIAIPFKAIEEILWYIEDNVKVEPEEDEIRIIKSEGYGKY